MDTVHRQGDDLDGLMHFSGSDFINFCGTSTYLKYTQDFVF